MLNSNLSNITRRLGLRAEEYIMKSLVFAVVILFSCVSVRAESVLYRTDTVAGQTQVLMNGMLATLPQVQAGKLKVLGVSKATRMPLLGSVPTIAEQGVKGFESGTWQGLLVPAAMPPAVLARLSAELTRIIRSPAVRERLVSQGAEVHTMSPTEFSAFFERERKQWAGVVAQSGVKID